MNLIKLFCSSFLLLSAPMIFNMNMNLQKTLLSMEDLDQQIRQQVFNACDNKELLEAMGKLDALHTLKIKKLLPNTDGQIIRL